MNTLDQMMPGSTEKTEVRAVKVLFQPHHIVVGLSDGRVIFAPLTHYPRLFYASNEELAHFEIVAGGRGISWPDLDEDLSVQGIAEGLPSRESKESIERWLASRGTEGAPRSPASRRRGISSIRMYLRLISDLYGMLTRSPQTEKEKLHREWLLQLRRNAELKKAGGPSK
jgi:hypothetical protein